MAIRQVIDGIRHNKEIPAFQKKRNMATVVIDDLKENGRFFNTPQGYFYFLEQSGPKLLAIEDRSLPLSAFIDNRYGVNEAETTYYKHLVNTMRNEAYLQGEPVDVSRLAHFDVATCRLYVSRFDGMVFRLDGENIELVTNGTDGVFFWDDPSWKRYELVDGSPTGVVQELFIDSGNFTGSELTVEDQRWLFHTWMLAQFFDSLHPTKPIVLIVGEKGSGKTSTLRAWMKFLFGPDANVIGLEKSRPDGFVAAVTSCPVAIFDNVDERINWLPDQLARLATGANFPMRKLYTTNERVEFKARSWTAMTSRTPRFIDNRDDVLDRTVILHATRLPKFMPEQVLLRRVAERRNEAWTELLHELNKVVAYAKKHGIEAEPVQHRMADFASFALMIGRVEGREGQVKQTLGRMERTQTAMLLEDEPISVTLLEWLKIERNVGRQVKTNQLVDELGAIAARLGIVWPYMTPGSLAQRLRHILPNLKQRFIIEDDDDSSNQKLYRFWLRQNAPDGKPPEGDDPPEPPENVPEAMATAA